MVVVSTRKDKSLSEREEEDPMLVYYMFGLDTRRANNAF
jgi:hypothetical protein